MGSVYGTGPVPCLCLCQERDLGPETCDEHQNQPDCFCFDRDCDGYFQRRYNIQVSPETCGNHRGSRDHFAYYFRPLLCHPFHYDEADKEAESCHGSRTRRCK